MSHETLDLRQLADYLHRDARELEKLAERDKIPGRKVSGRWQFNRAEVNQWLEGKLKDLSETQLAAVERGMAAPGRGRTTVVQDDELLVSHLISSEAVAVPLKARTRASVLKALVKLAEATGELYDPTTLLKAVRNREELLSTALPGGVAIPHPRRPLPDALGESIVAYGRTASGIPFGAAGGGLTDLFFLVCCRDDRTHLQVLARLARLFQRDGFLDDLRAASDPTGSLKVIRSAEDELIAAK